MTRISIILLLIANLIGWKTVAAEPTIEEVQRLSEQSARLKTHLVDANKLIESAEKNLKVAKAKVERMKKSQMKDPIRELLEYNKANDDLVAGEAAVDAAYANHKKYSEQLDVLLKRSNDMKAAQKAALAQEREEFEKKLLRTDIQLLKGKFNKESLGREMDKLDIGQYLEAKIGLLINSPSFCRVASACSDSKGQPLEASQQVTPAQLEREVFKGASKKIFKSDAFIQQSRKASDGTPAESSK